MQANVHTTPIAHGPAQSMSTDAHVYHRIPPAETGLPAKEATYRIHLSSGDALAGSTATNATFQVILNNQLRANKVKVVVESFAVNNGSAGALNNMWYRVHLRELVNRTSYSSRTNGLSDMLCSTTGYQFIPRQQSGTVVPAATFFANQTFTVTIESPCFTAAAYAWNALDTWDLTLAVVPV